MTDRRLLRIALFFCLFGLGIAIYLTYIHYAGIKPICNIAHGCIKVQSSQWAELDGIPVAVLGLVGYVGILGALVVGGEHGRLGAALFALVGFGFSMYLTYRELFSIHAICQWCVGSAIVMTVLAILTVWRLINAPVVARAT